jgi:Fe-S cluster assembly protein SufD
MNNPGINNIKMTNIELQEDLTRLYKNHAEQIALGTSGIINKYRGKAFEDFSRLGIPTRKTENYRYTDLMGYLEGDYSYELAPSNIKVNIEDLFRCDIPELNTHIILVLNGFYYQQNQFENLPEGMIISSFAEASIKYPELVNKHYSQYADTSLDSLAALNTLFAQDGIFVYIPKNTVLDKPIQIINIGFATTNLRITRRNLIIAEDNSDSSILVCDHTLCKQSFITNSLTEIYCGKNSRMQYVRMQNVNGNSSQLTNIFVHQEADSNFTSNTVSLHGGLIRNNIFAKMNGPGATNNSYGIFFGDDNQHIANFTHIHHAQPNCMSNQLYKGILDKKATGSFNGKIMVDKGAVKTVAYQRNNNILLSDESKMNTKPQLEIYNDDVKCSHGATIGQLDDNAMFYLRSRGIGYKEARHLMMFAFANEVIEKITLQPLQERMNDLVEKRLRGDLIDCENCMLHFIKN